MLTVAKFGGTSLCDGAAFLTVRDLILAEPARRGVVVSAPGRRFDTDPKITDLLYACHRAWEAGRPWQPIFRAVAERFRQIARDTGVFLNIEAELDALQAKIETGVTRDYLASRGEYFSALILARLLGWKFLDSAAWLRFDAGGNVDVVRSYGLLRSLADTPFVTPGFYGATPDGGVKTFSRGGSDITGALAAAALEASCYENFTDVPGILAADPRLLPDAPPVRHMTYGELAELTAVGTQVLHEGAVRPVREAGIPLSIRSTFCPEDPGTLITSTLPKSVKRRRLLCLASLRERALISLENAPEDALKELLSEAGVRADFHTAMLHRQTASVPSSCVEALMDRLGTHLGSLSLQDAVALVAVIIAREEQEGPVGADLLSALKQQGIPVHAILRPFGGHTLLLAVPEGDCLRAMQALSATA